MRYIEVKFTNAYSEKNGTSEIYALYRGMRCIEVRYIEVLLYSLERYFDISLWNRVLG